MTSLRVLINSAQDQYGYASTEDILKEIKTWLTQKLNQPLTYEGHERWKLLTELIEELK